MSSGMRSADRARGLLKQLFRTENADLDFGIYRIMNFKRAEIERFIDKDLIEAAEAEFKEFAGAGAAELENELEKRKREINDFVPGTIGEDWVVLKNHDLPKVKEFIGVLEEYRAASLSEEQVQDVFNHVYEFFSRYYEDGDFIPRTRYGGRDKYFIPYNGEEVLLHWSTKDMYYVKTGEYFNKYSFRAGRFRVTFKLVQAQIEQGNVRGDKKFFILHYEDPVYFDEASGEVEIRFNYRVLTDEEKEKYSGRKTQDDLIDEALTKIGSSLGVSSISGTLRPHGDEEKSLMRKHLEAYVERNTKDFFIHKDLKSFLSRELEFYLKNEVWDLNTLENTSESQTKLMMAKAKAVRGISTKIIEFLAQIEEFQRELFEKKKFVLRTDYCITLDLIPEEFYEEIGKNEEQVEEWRELFNIEDETKGTLLSINNGRPLNPELLKVYKHLVLDTRHFDEDFKLRLLEAITNEQDLDDLLNGLLIKSENFQALNLISQKYRERVECIYIDPPYNTGGSPFLYKNNYRHSTWSSMMHNVVDKSIEFLTASGVFISSIDDFEVHKLGFLLDNTFSEDGMLGILVVESKPSGRTQDLFLATCHEYYLFYSLNPQDVRIRFFELGEERTKAYKYEDDISAYKWRDFLRTGGYSTPEERPNSYYAIYYNNDTGKISLEKEPKSIEILPIDSNGRKRVWRKTRPSFLRHLKRNEISVSKGQSESYKVYIKDRIKKGIRPKSVWTGSKYDASTHGTKLLKSMFGGELLGYYTTPLYPKSLYAIQDVLRCVVKDNQDALVFDFFAGTGTTAHAVINMNQQDGGSRKYILVEMDDYFDTIMKPRIQKVMFSDEWKDGRPLSGDSPGGFFKYQILEQYEDTLNNIEFIQSDKSIQSRLDRMPDYFLTYMLDYETKDSSTRISFEQFRTPFDYRIKTISGGEEREELVDLVETFNYLLGLHINRLRAFKNGDRLYRVVYGTRGNEQVVVIWRDMPDLDLKRDKEFIENTVLSNIAPDTVYINGDSYLENTNPIELEFKRLMRV